MQKAEIQNLLIKEYEKANQVYSELGLELVSKQIRQVAYIEDGMDYTKCRCTKCGNVWTLKTTQRADRCPSCGLVDNNKYESAMAYRKASVLVTYRIMEDDSFIATDYAIGTDYKCNEDYDGNDIFSQLYGEWVESVTPKVVVYYDKENGFMTYGAITSYNESPSFGRKTSKVLQCFLSEVKFPRNVTLLYNLETKQEDDQITLLVKNAEEREKNKNENKPLQRAIEIRMNYQPKEFNAPEIKPVVKKLQDQYGSRCTYLSTCKKCGFTWPFYSTRNIFFDKEPCPKCGNNFHAQLKNGHLESEVNDFIVYEATNLPSKDLLIRKFSVTYEDDCKQVIRENTRFFATGKSKIYVFHKSNSTGAWQPGSFTRYDLVHGDYDGIDCHQTDEEVRDAILASSMAKSGLIEAIGVGDKNYIRTYDKTRPGKYLAEYHKYPSVELLAKASLPKILDYYCSNRCFVRHGDNLQDVIGLSKWTIKAARERKMSLEEAFLLDNMKKVEPSITLETYDNIKQSGCNPRDFCEVMRESEQPAESILRYLDNVYNYQCIEKRDAIQIWVDYIRMAKKCKFDLSDKSRRFPSSLKKEHDVAMWAYNKLKNQVSAEMFAKQATLNKSYEYSYDKFFVKIPETQEDVVQEATAQRNCLRSYIERIKDGNSVIAFIRKKAEPETSYVTVEISPAAKRIVQIKGYCNADPKGIDLAEFVQKWTKAKGLQNNIIIKRA